MCVNPDCEKKRNRLREIILKLAQNRINDFEQLSKEFQYIYSGRFRHYYSDITTQLLMIRKNAKLSIDLLGENLRELRKYAANGEIPSDFLDKLDKLIDHVQMDISRINEWDNLVNEHKIISFEMQKAQKKIRNANNEARNVKKDLLSIMGIFMAIFSLIQWNFSQYKDLLEYDPLSRVLFVLSIGSVLLISLYCVFLIIDFIVHRNPRMIKPFMNIETRRPTWFGFFTVVGYVIFLSATLWFLSNDSSRKTIVKLEAKIEQLNEDNITQANRNKSELNKKLKELEEKVEQLEVKLEKKSKYIESLEKDLSEKNKLDSIKEESF